MRNFRASIFQVQSACKGVVSTIETKEHLPVFLAKEKEEEITISFVSYFVIVFRNPTGQTTNTA